MRQKLAHSHATGRQGFTLGVVAVVRLAALEAPTTSATVAGCNGCWSTTYPMMFRWLLLMLMMLKWYLLLILQCWKLREGTNAKSVSIAPKAAVVSAKVVTIKSRLDLRWRSMKKQKNNATAPHKSSYLSLCLYRYYSGQVVSCLSRNSAQIIKDIQTDDLVKINIPLFPQEEDGCCWTSIQHLVCYCLTPWLLLYCIGVIVVSWN